ncbi:MAG: MFS transporter [Alphaproteobacteria bacterium]
MSETVSSDSPTGARRRQAWILLWVLSIAQVASWGTLYYGFSLFVIPMGQDLGWSRTAMNGALSTGLMVWGCTAYLVGNWIDRHGGRAVMTLGSILGGLVLIAWSQVESLVAFYLLWALLGLSMAATLYQPAFAVVSAAFGADYRKAITAMTLVGGFASTIFVPLDQFLIDRMGWRDALLVMGAVNLTLCAGIHFFALAGAAAAPSTGGLPQVGVAVRRALRTPVFWGLALWFTAFAAASSALTFHLVPLLAGRDVPMATVLLCVALIGPMQVAGRVLLMLFGTRLGTREIGRLIVAAMPLALLVLILAPPILPWLFLFALLHGTGNGVMTIVRGTAVPDLLGREAYGSINGLLAFPAQIATALAPVAVAAIWTVAGRDTVALWTMFGAAVLAVAGFLVAVATAPAPKPAAGPVMSPPV